MIYWVLARSRPRALGEIQDPGEKQKNTARGTFRKKSVCPKSFSLKLRNFSTLCVFANRTPRGGKSQNTGFLGPFGLGQPLGRAENGKTQFAGARGTFGKKSVRPKSFSPKLRNFFTFCALAGRNPTGGKSQITAVLGTFGLGQPLALREIQGRKQKNAISRT